MIKSISVHFKAERADYEKLLAGTKQMVDETTCGWHEEREYSDRTRLSTWPEGVYNLEDSIVISDSMTEEYKEFRANFSHHHPKFEKYEVCFTFHGNRMAWIEATINLLKTNGIPFVGVIFEDNFIGGFLCENWMETYRLTVPALEALYGLASKITRALREFSLDEIWAVDGCQKDEVGAIKLRIAASSLISSLAQVEVQDLRRFDKSKSRK